MWVTSSHINNANNENSPDQKFRTAKKKKKMKILMKKYQNKIKV